MLESELFLVCQRINSQKKQTYVSVGIVCCQPENWPYKGNLY